MYHKISRHARGILKILSKIDLKIQSKILKINKENEIKKYFLRPYEKTEILDKKSGATPANPTILIKKHLILLKRLRKSKKSRIIEKIKKRSIVYHGL